MKTTTVLRNKAINNGFILFVPVQFKFYISVKEHKTQATKKYICPLDYKLKSEHQ